MKRFCSLILLILCVLTSSRVVLAQSAQDKSRISELENTLSEMSPKEKIPALCEIAELYARHNTTKALKYLKSAEDVASKNKANSYLMMQIYDGYGSVYHFKKNYKESVAYYTKVSTLARKAKAYKQLAYSQFNIGITHKVLKSYSLAKKDFEGALASAKSAKDNSLMIQTYRALYETCSLLKLYKDAMTYYQKYVSAVTGNKGQLSSSLTILTSSYKGETKLKILSENEIEEKNARIEEMDSALTEVSQQNIALAEESDLKAQEIEQKEQKIEELSQQSDMQNEQLHKTRSENVENKELINRQRQVITAFIIVGVVVIALLLVLYFMFRKIKKINNRLENQKDEIETQKNLIQVKNEQITDSINYARKIQDSILVPENKIKRWLPDMFIYYKPKDIVSGDFYWFSKYESKYVITAIDCTGHGVPGAFLSMIGNTLLHEIVNIKHVFKPDQILAMLHTGITLALNQDSEDSGSEDGMDMSLCTVDTKLNRFQFAGAKNSLYVVQGDKLKILKANYYSIGGKPLRPDMKVAFTCYDFMYDDKTSIYMFSDGYLDQFGGEANEKFNAQRFKDMILENRNLPMEQQKEIFTQTMEIWKGDRQQIDDFLVMGIKLSGINTDQSIDDSQPKAIGN